MIEEERERKADEKRRLYNSYALSCLDSIQEIRSDLYADTYFNPTVINHFQAGQVSVDAITSKSTKYRELLESTAKDYIKHQESYQKLVQSFTSKIEPPSMYFFSKFVKSSPPVEVCPEPLQSGLDTLSKLCGDVVKVEFEYLAAIRSRWESSQLPLPERKKEMERFAEEMAETKEETLEQFVKKTEDTMREKRKEEKRRTREKEREERRRKRQEEREKEKEEKEEREKEKEEEEEKKEEREKEKEEKEKEREKEEKEIEIEMEKLQLEKLQLEKPKLDEINSFGSNERIQKERSAEIDSNDDSLDSDDVVDGSRTSIPSFETNPRDQMNHFTHSSTPSNNLIDKNKLKTQIHTFFESYSLLPSDLVNMATELDSILENGHTEHETHRILKEESWQLQGILNRVAFNRNVIQTCAQQLIHRIQSYHNQDVELVMKNYVAKRLIMKGKDASEATVCMSFSFLLAELASLDSLFVNMIMGQLYKECPLIRLEASNLDSLSAEKFEPAMMQHSMMIRLFAGLFLFNPRLFPIEFAWKWILLFIQLADCEQFLEAPQNIEAFLETCGFLLQKEETKFTNLLRHIRELTIPNLKDLPSFTSGSIARLKILVSSQHTFTDLYTKNLSSVYSQTFHSLHKSISSCPVSVSRSNIP